MPFDEGRRCSCFNPNSTFHHAAYGSSEVYFGTNAVPGAAELQGVTTDQFLELPPLQLETAYHWRVTTRRAGVRVPGPVWTFRTRGLGAVDHFAWGAIASPQAVNAAFPVSITAKDDLENTVTNFFGRVFLSGFERGVGERVQVLAFLAQADSAMDFRRTVAAISAHFTNFNATTTSATDVSTLRALLSSKEVFLIISQDQSTVQELDALGTAWGPVLQDFVQQGGVVIACSYARDEHLILQNSGLISLTKTGASRTATLVQPAADPLNQEVKTPFVGHYIAQYSTTNGQVALQTLSGSAVVISRDLGAGRAVMIGTDYSTNRTEMDQVIANVVRGVEGRSNQSVAVKPRVSGYFGNGVWSGTLGVQNVSPSVVLHADDGSGHTGNSYPLTVGAPDDLSVTLSDSADPVAVGARVAYTIVVSNSGPASVSQVVLTDLLPAGAILLGVTNQSGACILSNASLICQLGALAGGRSASVGLTLLPTHGGRMTNTVVVTGSPTEAFLENNQASAVTRVDVPSIFISDVATVVEGNEGMRGVVFTLRLEPVSAQMVSCDFATSNLVALAGSDYVAAAGTIVFPVGVTNQTLTIQVLGDVLNEGTESFAVVLSNPTNAAIAVSRGYGVIVDDDPLPSLSISSETTLEGDEGATAELLFRVGLSAPSGQTVLVNFATVDGTAVAALDYVATSGTLAFPPGTTNQTILVLVRGDRNSEADETFLVKLSSPVNANLAGSQGQGTIVDDDAGALDHFDWATVASPQYLDVPWAVALTAKDGLNNTIANFRGPVSLTGLTARRELAVGGASNVWNYPMGAYFHDQRLQAIYLAGELGAPAKITSLALSVSARPGQTLSNWTIRLKHTPLSHYTQGAWETEGWTTVYQKNEVIAGSGWITFPFTRPFDFNGTDHLMVDFSFNNAFYTSDGQCGFAPVSEPRSIFFQTDSGFGDPLHWGSSSSPPAEMAARVPAVRFNAESPVSISPAETGRFSNGVWAGSILVHEMVETMALRASDDLGHLGIANSFTVTALNDLSVAVSDSPHPVGVGQALTYHVALTNTGPGEATGVVLTDTLPASVQWLSAAVSQGSCTLVDGTVLRCELGRMPGSAAAQVEITVRPRTPGTLTNLVEVKRAKADAYLKNNMAFVLTPVMPPSLSIEDASLLEGTGGTTSAVVRVLLSSPSTEEISVAFSTAPKTASNLVDFAASKGRLTFPPGTTNQELSVTIVSDTLDEANETFIVRLSSPTNALLARSQATVTILDDDPPVVCNVNDAVVAEGNEGTAQLQFNVRLSSASGQIVFVSYATSNNTAKAGSDYQGASGTLLFPPGVTNRSLKIPIFSDRTIEPDKTLFLILSKPVNATLARDRAVGTILNDDGLSGVVDHFAWSPIPSPQYTNEPFAVAIAAQDFANSTVTGFNGTASLRGRTGDRDISVGEGNVPWPYPFATGYHDARSQVIYLTNELGAARRFVGLALDAILPPGQPMQRWTIRMKPTLLSSYSTSGWESNGWVTVYQGNENRNEEGEVAFAFSTPFAYDGIHNVMIDFSFNNDYFTSDGSCRSFEAAEPRSLSFQTDSGFGDPLAWTGTAAPVPVVGSIVPNLRLLSGFAVPIMPGAAGRFSDGVWTGHVSVRELASDMILLADDGSGHAGSSGVFSVLSIRDTDRDGLPDEWELRYFGSLNAPRGGPEDDPDEDGRTNLQEYLSGTDPLDRSNVLRITWVELRGGAIRLRFATVFGKQYRVEKADQLAPIRWTILADEIVGTGGVVEVKDSSAGFQETRFYRVRLLP